MAPEAFTFNGGKVEPGESATLRYGISETYLGDPVRIPVSIVNGVHEGPTLFLTAAAHGDELNGVQVVREVAMDWDLETLHGTLILLPVLNVPGFLAQQRYLPIYDRDLNRSFPGSPDGSGASRMADTIFRNFLEPADLGIDFHTSTRGRSNMLHVRGDLETGSVHRLARAFGSNVIIDAQGSEGTLRREAIDVGVTTITVEMGGAHRFQRPLIDRALEGVKSVFAEYGLDPREAVHWPGWRLTVGSDQKTWLRAPSGGLVEMHANRGAVVEDGDPVATITSPFEADRVTVEAPFTGLLIGALENPVVYPGNPLCHLVELDEGTRAAVETARRSGTDRTPAE